jgi:hypothetical protein
MPDEPERRKPETRPVSNLATAVALLAILAGMAGVLALLAAVGLPGPFLGIFGVFIGGGLVIGFHYVTWGWMASQWKDDDPEG